MVYVFFMILYCIMWLPYGVMNKWMNEWISCEDTTGQLKRRLWQTVTQFKAMLRLLAGWIYASQCSVRPYWYTRAEHDYISHTSLIVHFIISVTVNHFPIRHFPVLQGCKFQSPVSRRTGNVREVDQDETAFERLNAISSNKPGPQLGMKVSIGPFQVASK